MEKKESVKFDQGKPRFTLIPSVELGQVAEVLAYGAKKYGDNNWRAAGGLVYSRVFDALMRHLMAFWCGNRTDEESGLPHLAHAAVNCLFLLFYQNTRQGNRPHVGKDDRPGDYAEYCVTEEPVPDVVSVTKSNTKVHRVKCMGSSFGDSWTRQKTYSLRANDRNYEVGDVFIQYEVKYAEGKREYTGRQISAVILSIRSVKDGFPNFITNDLPDNWVCMQLSDMKNGVVPSELVPGLLLNGTREIRTNSKGSMSTQ